jgi:CBS domain-containing protein
MKVREIMTTDVVTATPDTTLDQIAGMMRDQDVGAIPILDDDQLVGIVTDRDIVVRCIAEGKDPSETSVEEVLIEEELETILPDVDAEEAAQLMASKQIRRLPVIEDEVLVGIVSLGDISAKGDSEAAGEALEDVSQGVKKGPQASGQQSRGAGSGGRSGHQSSSASASKSLDLAHDEYSELELEEDEMQEEELRGESRSAQRMNRGQSELAASRSGRSSEDSRGRASSGRKRPPQSSGRQGEGQGISIRGKKQEQPRQQKVAPARAQGKNAGKRRAG